MQEPERVVAVWPLAGFDKTLHYRAAGSLARQVAPGSLARAPIGRRQALGVVFETDVAPDVPLERLKLLSQVAYPFPVLTPPLLKLARWIADYYAARREAVLEAMIPAPARNGMRPRLQAYLSLAQTLDPEALDALAKRAPRQAQLYQFVAQQTAPQKKSLLLDRLGLSASAAKALVEKGVLAETAVAQRRDAYDDPLGQAERVAGETLQLNEEQRAAVAAIEASMASNRHETRLLQGVTGSGKTEVYLMAMERALASDKSVLFLVPEVALTPQTVGRVRARFADWDVVVWHSHLSEGERMDAWMAALEGKARIVVGARSAVFAPLQRLGLVIVDEEHEPAYKQDETPRYHGRDVAVYRAYLEGAVCVLGSATPSLETYRNAKTGKYQCDRLSRRVDDRSMPVIEIVDMRREILRSRKPSTLSRALASKLRERFEKREQSILYINRRGYASSMICQECGYVAVCDHCSVPMTYHRSDETLKCHLCGHEAEAPLRCPECKSRQIRRKGLGTQRVEDVARRLLPKARIARIDTDTMSRKHLFREILEEFRAGKIDMLVGTQMIAKGLDFPNVTLVGLVDADLSLHLADFRAHERTFQLLVQVSGRSGRGDLAGEVVVQTFTPHADPIQFARHADVDAFLEVEAEQRAAHQYPPYRRLVRHLFRGPNADKVAFFAEQFAKRLEERAPGMAEIRGPAPCAIEKMKDHYRFQIWYFTAHAPRLVKAVRGLAEEIPWPKDVVQVIDVDPMSLS